MIAIRKAYLWLAFVFLGTVILCWNLMTSSRFSGTTGRHGRAAGLSPACDLFLTDLCLFTDARYLRHLSQADHHSAFQDHPAAFDYFPSGSLVSPPVSIWESTDDMAASTDSSH